MRALLGTMKVAAASASLWGCGGDMVNIGAQDSGGTDSCTGQGCNGSDGASGTDSGNDSGGDSGRPGVDGGECMTAGGTAFQCATTTCKDNYADYCINLSPGTCNPIPGVCCGANRTCACVLANLPPNTCPKGTPTCMLDVVGNSVYIGCM